jgi:very-short-patch-repair endonuclease
LNPARKTPGFGKWLGGWNKGEHWSEKTKEKISMSKLGVSIKHAKQFKVGHIPWNKGIPRWWEGTKCNPYTMRKNGYISRPQRLLKKIVEMVYEKPCEMEYYIKTQCSWRFADVAIPALKIDFEFDGEKWHSMEKDQKRDAELKAVGWTVYHFRNSDVKHPASLKTEIESLFRQNIRRCS